MKIWKHFKTITKHKILVMKTCFKVGLYQQGLLHDLSKYMPVEFMVGAKYYKGDSSPNNEERTQVGYSSAWLHHKGRNKHHFEYWIDYGNGEDKSITGMRMPDKYIIEMFIDRMCASKNYQGKNYTQESPLKYYENGKAYHMLHEEVQELLEELLIMLADEGEEKTLSYIKNSILKHKNIKNK